MAELPQGLQERIQRLGAEGDDLLNQGRHADALARYESAWQCLPEPRTEWSIGSGS